MIYLIDDNRRDQQKEYHCQFLAAGTYSHFIKPLYRLTPDEDLNFLKSADAIFVHSSFPDFDGQGKVIEGQSEVYEKIFNLLKDEPAIPYVLFSNGDTEPAFDPENPLGLDRINKRLFYLNLGDFLTAYEKDKVPELRILAYGGNFLSRDMLVLFDRLNSLFLSGAGMKEKAEIERLSRLLGELVGGDPRIPAMLATVLKGESEFNAYLTYLEKIIKAYIRHGRNIYHQ
ncbi:hypothetical protein IDJ75_11460 [Mucilaginibacter rigui]|uniref:Uncharacterized protein n=1 Tax=Mucilaginibacter rigui TaxID=534635 RepID=A0ABR7X5Q4_9SPHI|nr:hypothetical protein [Mucilaginibacter rigui]MBD1385899.1 hypothetical protein [Mucilaginibacter rigui]